MRCWSLVALLVAAPAGADPEPDPHLPPQQVTAHLDGTVARFVERVAFATHGEGLATPVFVQLPAGAVVTAGAAIAAGAVHRLELVPADEAAARLDALGKAAPDGPRPWALEVLDQGDHGSVELDAATPRAAHLAVSLEGEVGSCFFRDVRYVAVPAAWKPLVARELVVRDEPDGLEEACGGGSDTTWLAFAAPELTQLPPGEPRIGAISERLALPAEHLAHVELDLSRQVMTIPADLHTAIVIDGSRSLTLQEADVQRAIVAGYLRAAPHGSVQVIEYARDAHSLLPAWMPAALAAPRVDRAIRELPGRNGSSLEAGLAEAARWLERVDGTRRIILFTDERFAQRFEALPPTALARVLPERTLLHVVALETERGTLARADDDRFAPLAAMTQGIAVHGRVDKHDAVDATLLARPIALEHVQLAAPGWTTLSVSGATCGIGDDGAIDEGRSCEWWGRGPAAAGPVTITGLLWNRRFERMVRPDPSRGRRLARALSVVDELDDALKAQVDRAAFAVNQAWSLFATWGGRGGYGDLDTEGDIGLGGFGTCGCGDGGISDTFGFGTATIKLDLRSQFARGVGACRHGQRVTIGIETTREEIVDVDVDVAP
ncbi:MAG: VWA domain-containing protein, partial [Acidobacteriota bacterium]